MKVWLVNCFETEKSRLSELSRPPDLREVDCSDAAVVALFAKELAFEVWHTIIPAHVKEWAFSLCDDFVFSFCMSKVGSWVGGWL